MKYRWKLLLSIICVLLLAAGCAKKEEVPEKEPSKETESKGQADPKEEESVEEQSQEEESGLLKHVEQQEYTTAKGINLEPGTYIAVVAKAKDSDYWKEVKRGASQAVKDINSELGYSGDDKVYMTFDAPTEAENVDEQVNVVDQVLNDYPEALCLSVIDMQSFAAQLDYTVENSIPVIAFDSGIDNDAVLSLTATNNKEAAAEAARQMCEMIGDEGEIALLMHNQISETGLERKSGFEEEIEKNHPDVKIVDVSYTDNGEEPPDEAVKRVMEEYPDLKGYFASSYAAEKVIRETTGGREDLVTIGFDGSSEQITAVKDGTLNGTIVQNPYAIGYTSIIAAAKSIMEEEVESYIDTGYIFVAKHTMDDEEIQEFIK